MPRLYQIEDRAAESTSPPMAFHTDAEAMRYFKHECLSGEGQLARFSIDHVLWFVGTYDQGEPGITGATEKRLMDGRDIQKRADALTEAVDMTYAELQKRHGQVLADKEAKEMSNGANKSL